MREAFVDVFVDDEHVVENQVAFDENREFAVRADRFELSLMFGADAFEVERLDAELTSLFMKNNAAALGERARGARKKRHGGQTLCQ